MTHITIPRAVVEKALQALEWMSDCYVGDDDDAGECASCHERSYKPHAPDCKKNNAITALRAALAEHQEANEVCDGSRGAFCIHQDPSGCNRERDCPAFAAKAVSDLSAALAEQGDWPICHHCGQMMRPEPLRREHE